jgi:hypothetical protein
MLRPAFFVSYSRQQAPLAGAVRTALSEQAKSVWFDLDRLAVGDAWRKEIARGIEACDELVLLVSDASLRSREVWHEVDAAVAARKIVRPVIVERLSTALPPSIQRLHCLDVARLTRAAAIAAIAALLRHGDTQITNEAALKQEACRDVYPPADADTFLERTAPRRREIYRDLTLLTSQYPPSSTIWMNAGLTGCLAGDWSGGVARLRAYAQEANTFAGWYFLALHLPMGRSIRTAAPAVVGEARAAIELALAFRPHALTLLTAAVLEAGGANYGTAHLDMRLAEFTQAARSLNEDRGEVMRLYWCLRPSLPALRHRERAVVSLLMELAN